jgi:hypothetical protein
MSFGKLISGDANRSLTSLPSVPERRAIEPGRTEVTLVPKKGPLPLVLLTKSDGMIRSLKVKPFGSALFSRFRGRFSSDYRIQMAFVLRVCRLDERDNVLQDSRTANG